MALKCKQMTKGVYPVESSSDASKTYEVTAFNGYFPQCNCVAFKINRNKRVKELGLQAATTGVESDVQGNCKHVDHVMNTVCQWEQRPGIVAPLDGKCPECGGPTVETDPTARPADQDEFFDVQSALMSIVAELDPNAYKGTIKREVEMREIPVEFHKAECQWDDCTWTFESMDEAETDAVVKKHQSEHQMAVK